jgi:hypothetical protein
MNFIGWVLWVRAGAGHTKKLQIIKKESRWWSCGASRKTTTIIFLGVIFEIANCLGLK